MNTSLLNNLLKNWGKTAAPLPCKHRSAPWHWEAQITRPCRVTASPSDFQSSSTALKDNNGSCEMDQVETEVLFIQDNPDFSALSYTPNKEETLLNSTCWQQQFETGTHNCGWPQLQESMREPEADSQAYEGLTCRQTDLHLDPQIV